MQIYFIGMPANMLYTFGASILRAVGDTPSWPLYYLSVAGVINVVLNLFLVIVCNLAVAGVAIATVISQIVSMVLVMACLMRSKGAFHLDLRKVRFHGKCLLEILRVGLPAGLQGSLFSISNVLIQSAVNSFGSTVMAGNAAASNLEGFNLYVHERGLSGRHDLCQRQLWRRRIQTGAQDPVAVSGHGGCGRLGSGNDFPGVWFSAPEYL